MTKRSWLRWVLLAVLIVAAWLRLAGIYRGLDGDYVYHPDEPKQVAAARYFLLGVYVCNRGYVVYDGYPYGLNHVDELLFRTVYPVVRRVYRLMHVEKELPAFPERADMYYPLRFIRLLYGMLVVWLTYVLGQRLFRSQPAALAAAGIVAVSPLASTVCHFAAGDIGVDLFCALMFLALTVHVDVPKRRYMFLAGLLCGLGAACKYNGLLCLATPILYLLVRAIREGWKQTRPLGSGLLLFLGFVLGFVILTPTVLIEGKDALEDIMGFMVYIRDHAVAYQERPLPFFTKAYLGLTRNTGRVIAGFGWVLMALYTAGALALAYRALPFGAARKQEMDGRQIRLRALACGICAFPLGALLLCLVTKLRVQPFHFSYLAAPVALGAAGTWQLADASGLKALRRAVPALLLLVLVELGVMAEREHFFWCREDALLLARRLPRKVFPRASAFEMGDVRNLSLEPEGTAIFRNREDELASLGGTLWQRMGTSPVPTVPADVSDDWVFLNGPAFPRNDRLFWAERDTRSTRHVVLHEPPGPITIGLRSGLRPARVNLTLGERSRELTLAPDEQALVVVEPKRWRCSRGRKRGGRTAYLVPLRVHAQLGGVAVAVMKDQRDIDRFETFGGTIETSRFVPDAELEDLEFAAEIDAAPYLAGDLETPIDPSAEEGPSTAEVELVRTPLPCGAFRFVARGKALVANTELALEVRDVWDGKNLRIDGGQRVLEPGWQDVVFPFAKPFAPHQCRLVLHCRKGAFRFDAWEMRPDAVRIRTELSAWSSGGARPTWLRRFPEKAPFDGVRAEAGIRFDDSYVVRECVLPESARCGEELFIRCGVEATRYPARDFDRLHIFVHLVDASGNQAWAGGCPLANAVMSHDSGVPLSLGWLPALAPGKYDVHLGIWNRVTFKRLRVQAEGRTRRERDKRIRIGSITLSR